MKFFSFHRARIVESGAEWAVRRSRDETAVYRISAVRVSCARKHFPVAQTSSDLREVVSATAEDSYPAHRSHSRDTFPMRVASLEEKLPWGRDFSFPVFSLRAAHEC